MNRHDTMAINTTTSTLNHPVVSKDRWIGERKSLLAREKELTRLQDQITAERRALPWERVDKHYVFDAPEGPRSLADLFDGRRKAASTVGSCCFAGSTT